MMNPLAWDRFAGVLLVVALHAAALWGLWNHRLLVPAQEAVTVFVDFIAPPVAQRVAAAPKREPPPKPRADGPPPARSLVAVAPVAPIAPAAPLAEVTVAPAPTSAISLPVESQPSAPAGPVTLAAELSAACPERSAPSYPLASRRMGETGTAVLRVELDEQGQVVAARVAGGSGFARLDEAALAAVKTWRCNPAQRDGRPVRAVALQAFKFVLQGN